MICIHLEDLEWPNLHIKYDTEIKLKSICCQYSFNNLLKNIRFDFDSKRNKKVGYMHVSYWFCFSILTCFYIFSSRFSCLISRKKTYEKAREDRAKTTSEKGNKGWFCNLPDNSGEKLRRMNIGSVKRYGDKPFAKYHWSYYLTGKKTCKQRQKEMLKGTCNGFNCIIKLHMSLIQFSSCFLLQAIAF